MPAHTTSHTISMYYVCHNSDDSVSLPMSIICLEYTGQECDKDKE